VEDKDPSDDLERRFPAPPKHSDVPEPPKIEVKLPPSSTHSRPGNVVPGRYQKLAVAATAATSFVAPIVVLGVAGWWLDQRLHSTAGLCAFAGVVLGFIAGIVSLLGVIRQLKS